jgi:EmrB/QacA subfamily drug resistance transporter
MSSIAQTSLIEHGRRRWWVLLITCVPLFMMMLDITIVNIALPDIMNSFNTGISTVEWVLNAYILAFAVLLITLGKLGDLYGRKLLFLGGLGLFTVSSLACGLAPNITTLIVARVFQALGGAAMMPATLSILNVAFGDKRGMALGIWGAVAGVASALGPIIGGALVDAYSWRWIFLINLPVGVLAFIAAIIIIRESTDPTAERRIDIPGVLAISTALFCLTYALVEGQKYGWGSALIVGLFAASFVTFVAFLAIERKIAAPLIRLNLFRNRTFTAGNSVGLILMFGLLSIIFLLVLFMQLVLDYSAIKTGLVLLPLAGMTMIVAPISGRLSDTIGSRWLLFFGMAFAALGIYLMSNLTPTEAWQHLMAPLAVCGLGMGLVMAPTTSAVMASAPMERSGQAAGILATMRQVGSVLGISVIGAILQSQLVSNLREALLPIPQIPAAAREQILSAVSSGRLGLTGLPNIPGPLGAQLETLFKQEFADSLNTAMIISVYICIVGALVALLVRSHVSNQKTKTAVP